MPCTLVSLFLVCLAATMPPFVASLEQSQLMINAVSFESYEIDKDDVIIQGTSSDLKSGDNVYDPLYFSYACRADTYTFWGRSGND